MKLTSAFNNKSKQKNEYGFECHTHTQNVHALEEKNTKRNESTKQNRRKFDCVLITQTYELGKNIGNACNLIDRRH